MSRLSYGYFYLNFCKIFNPNKTNMTKFECTSKVQKLRNYNNDDEISKKIGISKPTLYVRLKTHNWKVSEIHLIESLKL